MEVQVVKTNLENNFCKGKRKLKGSITKGTQQHYPHVEYDHFLATCCYGLYHFVCNFYTAFRILHFCIMEDIDIITSSIL